MITVAGVAAEKLRGSGGVRYLPANRSREGGGGKAMRCTHCC